MQAAQHNTAINQPFVDAHTQSKLQELKVLQRRVFQIRKTLRKAQTNQLDKSVMRDQNKGASNQEGRRATQTEAGSLQIKFDTDFCVSSLPRAHVNLLSIVPILLDECWEVNTEGKLDLPAIVGVKISPRIRCSRTSPGKAKKEGKKRKVREWELSVRIPDSRPSLSPTIACETGSQSSSPNAVVLDTASHTFSAPGLRSCVATLHARLTSGTRCTASFEIVTSISSHWSSEMSACALGAR
eukprot:3450633-Rhodomonas_salina.2